MQIINKYNEEIPFLLRVINIISKYACVVTLNNNQKGTTTNNAFQKSLDESGQKPNTIWVDQRSELYNRSMKLWLKDKNIEIY